MADYPTHMPVIERRICDRLITEITRRGYFIRVFDGEDYATTRTQNKDDIRAETSATDVTVYEVYDRDPGRTFSMWRRIGNFVLIHGNGEDVLSDYSWATGNRIEDNERLMKQIADAVEAYPLG
jgi:hypothetical protein